MKITAIFFSLTFISSIAFAQSQTSRVGNMTGTSGAGASAASYAATGKAIIQSDTVKQSKDTLQPKSALVGAALPGGSIISNAVNTSAKKQTQGTTFGEKVNQGLHSAGQAVANGSAKADQPLYNGNSSTHENPLHESAAKIADPGNPIGGIIVKGGKNRE